MSIPTSDRYMMIDMMIDLISHRYMFPGDIILPPPPLFSPFFFVLLLVVLIHFSSFSISFFQASYITATVHIEAKRLVTSNYSLESALNRL
ncbi:hypothetical protein I7I48_00242 [Histoplasma ohiense]|nr:hypothetical protein I7I48_00242 [Histoplasma ohiense (nom. inval.)]